MCVCVCFLQPETQDEMNVRRHESPGSVLTDQQSPAPPLLAGPASSLQQPLRPGGILCYSQLTHLLVLLNGLLGLGELVARGVLGKQLLVVARHCGGWVLETRRGDSGGMRSRRSRSSLRRGAWGLRIEMSYVVLPLDQKYSVRLGRCQQRRRR